MSGHVTMKMLEIWEKIETGELSRNKNYRFFVHPPHYQALKLHRYLKHLSQWIQIAETSEDIHVSISTESSDRYRIILKMNRLRHRWISFINHDSLIFIARNPSVRKAILRNNISVPSK